MNKNFQKDSPKSMNFCEVLFTAVKLISVLKYDLLFRISKKYSNQELKVV